MRSPTSSSTAGLVLPAGDMRLNLAGASGSLHAISRRGVAGRPRCRCRRRTRRRHRGPRSPRPGGRAARPARRGRRPRSRRRRPTSSPAAGRGCAVRRRTSPRLRDRRRATTRAAAATVATVIPGWSTRDRIAASARPLTACSPARSDDPMPVGPVGVGHRLERRVVGGRQGLGRAGAQHHHDGVAPRGPQGPHGAVQQELAAQADQGLGLAMN